MIYDPTPLVRRNEDSAAPDLQAIVIELGELLQEADRHVSNLMEALRHRDLIEGARLAQMWGSEAHTTLRAAIRTRETLAKEQRTAGLLRMPYSDVGVS